MGRQLTRNFNEDELRCPCCGFIIVIMPFVERLQQARDIAMIPFPIESWCRCILHNAEVGGKPDSSHPKGCATDIIVRWGGGRSQNATRWIIWDALKQVGFTRFGIAKNTIHVDDDPVKPPFRIWTYY